MGLFTLWWINIDPENKPFLVETNLPTPIWPCQEDISIDCMIFLLAWDVEPHILREFHPPSSDRPRLQLEALPEGFHNRYLAASEVEALQWMADALDARMEPWRYDVHSKIVWIYGCSMMFIIWWIVVLVIIKMLIMIWIPPIWKMIGIGPSDGVEDGNLGWPTNMEEKSREKDWGEHCQNLGYQQRWR